MAKLTPQCQQIVQFLRENGTITTLDAFNIGITRLSSRIYDLKEKGYSIQYVWENGFNRHGYPVRYKRYSLAKEAPVNPASCSFIEWLKGWF